jgi:transposase
MGRVPVSTTLAIFGSKKQKKTPFLSPLTTPAMDRPPETQKRKHLSLDERLRIRTLYFDAKWTQKAIATHFGISEGQVQYACKQERPTPRRRSGRPVRLTAAETEKLIAFVCGSKEGRQTPWNELPAKLGFRCSEYAIRTALRNAGFERHIARRKPYSDEKVKQARKDFCAEARFGQRSNGNTSFLAARRGSMEERIAVHALLDVPVKSLTKRVVDPVPKKKGWMFWGCLGVGGKGPGIFWEKDWGTVSAESYCEHIIPIVDGWFRLTAIPSHIFMQDNAPGHAAKATIAELMERKIPCLAWPPFSPDLNPIETVWLKMKDWIEERYSEAAIRKMSYDRLREVVRNAWNAWNAIDDQYLDELLDTMQKRCEDCYNTDGGPTGW